MREFENAFQQICEIIKQTELKAIEKILPWTFATAGGRGKHIRPAITKLSDFQIFKLFLWH